MGNIFKNISMFVHSGCLQAHHSNNPKQIIHRRQISWLFTKNGEVEFGATELTNPASGREKDLNPGPPGLQVQRPNHYTTPPLPPPLQMTTGGSESKVKPTY